MFARSMKAKRYCSATIGTMYLSICQTGQSQNLQSNFGDEEAYLAGQSPACHFINIDQGVALLIRGKVTGGGSIVEVDVMIGVILHVRDLLLQIHIVW